MKHVLTKYRATLKGDKWAFSGKVIKTFPSEKEAREAANKDAKKQAGYRPGNWYGGVMQTVNKKGNDKFVYCVQPKKHYVPLTYID